MTCRVTSVEQLPKECEEFILGFDLDLSGWGEFAYPETPERTFGMDYDEYHGRGEWRGHKYRHSPAQLCPVLFGLTEHDDEELLKFTCRRQNVVLWGDARPIPWGKPQTEPEEGWDKWAENFKRENAVFEHSIVFGFIAGLAIEKFSATGMHKTLEWLLKRGHPFACLRTRENAERWFTEPALGHTFYDDEEIPFKYCHPRQYPKKGDYALVTDRRGQRVQLQRYTYTGRNRRYKVIPQEA